MDKHFETFGHEKIRRTGKNDCLICHRKRELRRRRLGGVKPRPTDYEAGTSEKFPCGHSRSLTRKTVHGCRVCHREKERGRYKTNPEHYRKKGAERSARYKIESPEKVIARSKLNHAIESGKIKRQPCEICKSPRSQGHHSDYSKPLEVRWFCALHHAEFHAQLESSVTL